LGLGIAGSNEYLDLEDGKTRKRILELKTSGKVWVTEFGACNYEGAMENGGAGYKFYKGEPYSQEEQVRAVEESLKVYRACGVDGVFLWNFINKQVDDTLTFSIMKFRGSNLLMRRKPGFYAYQSFSLS
jgi:hypothetical protein